MCIRDSSQDWRSMKTALSRPCSLMATRTVVTALPAPVVNFSSGSAVKRPVMVTVFMVIPLLWVAVGKRRLRGKDGASGVPAGPRRSSGGTVHGQRAQCRSRRSERRRKLSAALTPAGPVHHLGGSQPHPREGCRTLRTPAGVELTRQLYPVVGAPEPSAKPRMGGHRERPD